MFKTKDFVTFTITLVILMPNLKTVKEECLYGGNKNSYVGERKVISNDASPFLDDDVVI